jgi:hypothetical protein
MYLMDGPTKEKARLFSILSSFEPTLYLDPSFTTDCGGCGGAYVCTVYLVCPLEGSSQKFS